MRAIVFSLLLLSCSCDGIRWPKSNDATCESYCAASIKMGCEKEPARCVADCNDTVKAERKIGRVYPLGCMQDAASCALQMECR